MLPDQYDTFSNLLKNHYGRNPYFERRNGRHPMPPEEQQLIRQALERVGVASTLEFDNYKDYFVVVLTHKDSSPRRQRTAVLLVEDWGKLTMIRPESKA